MGNSSAPIGTDLTPISKLIESQADYQVYESPAGQQFQRYVVSHDGSEHFEQLYRFRIENRHPDMVDLLFAGPAQGFMGCTERGRFEVITERIPYRLESLSGIQSRNALVILRTSLRGFRDVYRKHGAVGVAAEMIGINTKSKVKVWLNRNFAINTPQHIPASSASLSEQDQEREMVLSIFDLVDSKAQHDNVWFELMKFKQTRNPRTFDEALNMLDYFSGANRINIQDTVSNLFNKRAYHPEKVTQNVIHIENNGQVSKVHAGVQQSVKVMRKPFEELDSRAARVDSFPIYFHQTPQIKSSQLPQIQPIQTLPQNHSIQVASATRPMIKFNTKTAPTQHIPQYITPIPIVNHQNLHISSPPPSQIVSFVKHQIRKEDSKQSENIIFRQNRQVNNEKISEISAPHVIIQQQILKQPKAQKQVEIRVVQSFQPQTEQAQIILSQEPVIEEGYLAVANQYEVNVHQVSSQQSLHQQLATYITQHKIPQQKQENSPKKQQQYKIRLSMEENIHQEDSKVENSIKSLQSLKTVINPSLVDTRQIKRTSTEHLVLQQEMRPARSLRNQRNDSISYREMRRLLLQELSN